MLHPICLKADTWDLSERDKLLHVGVSFGANFLLAYGMKKKFKGAGWEAAAWTGMLVFTAGIYKEIYDNQIDYGDIWANTIGILTANTLHIAIDF